jgi:hypothetical protein
VAEKKPPQAARVPLQHLHEPFFVNPPHGMSTRLRPNLSGFDSSFSTDAGPRRISFSNKDFVKPPFFEPIAMRESSSFRSSLS